MLDYKLLEALGAVINHAGFERAARSLGLTQSAVSQRIKLLEARLGQPVLVRSPVLAATDLGRRLLNHTQQVRLLEDELIEAMPQLSQGERRLRVAINADSLTTWWPAAIGDFLRLRPMLFDLVVEDQDIGLERMRQGDVGACLCSSPKPVQGARVIALGHMRYRALASPDFLHRHLPDGPTPEALATTPAIVFGPNDQLQHRFLASLGVTAPFPYHLCGSTEGFLRLALAGIGFGLMPELQVTGELDRGTLQDVAPGHVVDVPLYWHYWRQGGETLTLLANHLARQAPRWLSPLHPPPD